jgi:Flp pilus assembly protein TadG
MIRLRSLRGDERGASIIELALVLPIFGSMVVGVTDLSRAYSQKLILEQSAYRAIEKVQQYQSNASTYNTLKTEAVAAATAAGFSDVTSSSVTVDYWLECNGVRQSDYNTTCSTEAGTARWVTIDITHNFTPMFATSKWPGANADGTYTLHGRAGLRTQ